MAWIALFSVSQRCFMAPASSAISASSFSSASSRVFDGGLVDEDLLEAPLERRVLLDVLAVLVEGRRADRMQLAAGEHRLEQVRGVHRALRRARADDRVQLVDEQDDPAVRVLDLLEDGLEALFELAPELGAGDEGAEVERDDALVLE